MLSLIHRSPGGTIEFMRNLLLALLLLASPFLRSDEGRFDPPLKGAYLGVSLGKISAGLVVLKIEDNSAARAAGLRRGDVLVRFGHLDELPHMSVRQLWEALSKLPGRAAYELAVLRDERKVLLEITPDPALVRDARALARRLKDHRLFTALKDKKALLGNIEIDLIAAVRRSRSTQSAYEALNEVLGRFGISHTAVIPPWSYASMLGKGSDGKPVFHLGLTIQKVASDTGERFFVRELMYGGGAREAGLRIGDELVAVNGLPFSTSPRRTLAGYEARHAMYTIQVDTEESVRIDYRREAGGAVRSLAIAADRASTAIDSTRKSIRMLGAKARGLGYIHLWNLLSPEIVSIFKKALRKELGSARALVIDLRGRGGQVPVLKAIAKRIIADGRPTALLIDDLTRSAKEIVAYMLKGKKGITLIGETTAGAVRAAGYITFEDRARVMIPVNVRMRIESLTGGIDLEGRGVSPDAVVEFHLPFLAGRDPILERSISLLHAGAPKPARRRI